MNRLLVLVEGEAEEVFVNEILSVHLYQYGYQSVSARLMGNARQRDRRGGVRAWGSVKGDILIHLREDPGARVTTMVDYYAMPKTGGREWPGRAVAAGMPYPENAGHVEAELLQDICAAMTDSFDPRRFIPYLMMHEFEGMLFSDCEKFARGIGQPEMAAKFQEIRDQFANPELINDSLETAPSKRIGKLIPGYQKPFLGNLAIPGIGLTAICEECPRFSRWISRLETLPG